MVMFSHATSHANRSKKNTYTARRALSIEASVIPHKPEIVVKDKNGNDKYPYSLITKQPVFAQRRMNRSKSQNDVESYTQEHENIVEYISSTWLSVKRDLDKKSQDPSEDGGPVYYREKESNPKLDDFEPFDLERWMADRLFNKITSGSS